jgi:signal transduction histidine kinase
MRHVIISLIANSLDAMPDGGELTVSSRIEKSDGRVEVVIKDTGCGIPIEQMGKIFKPFYTTKSKGMGVGLSLAKRIIERHGGTLRLESEAAVGTTVFMHIPLAG